MTTASDLIKGALRLINVPGLGASLAAEDQSNALSALQELLNTNAVSKQFTPGIKRHFFTLSLIHISEPTRRHHVSRMPSSA